VGSKSICMVLGTTFPELVSAKYDEIPFCD
jgi:hypothetical protein